MANIDMTKIGRIDTHAHVVPPAWRQSANDQGWGNADGMPRIPVGAADDRLDLSPGSTVADKNVLTLNSHRSSPWRSRLPPWIEHMSRGQCSA